MGAVSFTSARFARLLEGWSRAYGPLSIRLADAIREHIRSGQLPAGARLPSERDVAKSLGIARTTVSAVFDALRLEGLLVSRTGVGTFVTAAGRHATARGDDRLGSFAHEENHARFDLRSAALPAVPLVREMLALQYSDEFADVLKTHGYIPSGLGILRSAIADYYQAVGLATHPNQILVTSGAQQAIRIVAHTLVERGDAVILEEPTYRGAIEVMRSAGARLTGVPSDVQGISSDALADCVRRQKPALVVLQSTVHNPTGSVLPEQTRVAIAELSARAKVTIVDHLVCMDALIDGTIPRPLAAYGGHVLTIGSASKAFWGGLRVGWIRGDPDLITHFTAVKSAEDLGTSVPAQLTTARLLYRIDEARAYRRATLGAARELVVRSLADRLPDWRPLPPAGGASMWIGLPNGFSSTTLAERAGRAGVDLLPGTTFSSENRLDGWLRVAFAGSAEAVEAGIQRLSEVWQAIRDGSSAR
ncbi:MAG: PLP-dependent aminotransferase family protein [Acidobacteria bacterium]|nr:PLP-dependent aminotransferase family protein [Acidobacteriota bacterium]